MTQDKNHLSISPQDLLNCSDTLESLSEDMRRNLSDMTECIKELTEIWRDKNGVDFVRRYTDEVEPQLRNYYGLVEKHSGFVSGAANAYRAYINDTSASING